VTGTAAFMSTRHVSISVAEGIKQISIDDKAADGHIVLQRAESSLDRQGRMFPSSSGSIWTADCKSAIKLSADSQPLGLSIASL
jgi:hypothetical protein